MKLFVHIALNAVFLGFSLCAQAQTLSFSDLAHEDVYQIINSNALGRHYQLNTASIQSSRQPTSTQTKPYPNWLNPASQDLIALPTIDTAPQFKSASPSALSTLSSQVPPQSTQAKSQTFAWVFAVLGLIVLMATRRSRSS